MCGSSYTVQDIEDAFYFHNSIKDAISPFHSDHKRTTLSKILYSLEFDSVESLYSAIVQTFINTLKLNVRKSLYRNRRVNIAVNVAMEIFLASVQVSWSRTLKNQQRNTEATTKPKAQGLLTLPIHGSSQPRYKSNNLVLPSPTLYGPEQSNSRQGHDEKNESSQILTKYARFSKPLSATYKAADRVLEHWTIGENPDEYDFMQRMMTEQKQAELEAMSEEQRRQTLRREERLSQRQERESQRYQEASQRLESMGVLGFAGDMLASQSGGTQSLLRSALLPGQSSQMVESQASRMETPIESQPLKTQDGEPPKKKKKRTKGF